MFVHRLLQSIVMEPNSLPSDTLDSVSTALPFTKHTLLLFNVALPGGCQGHMNLIAFCSWLCTVCIVSKLFLPLKLYVVEILLVRACGNKISTLYLLSFFIN